MIRRMLDLYCGAGGAAMGYHRAFGPDVEILGVDIEPQPHYPFIFIQADALEFMRDGRGDGFDFYHASPPCQAHTALRALWQEREYPDLLSTTRKLLRETKRPYAIENVMGAPLVLPIMLCGTMFGLKVYRHRLFETNPWMLGPSHGIHPETIPRAGKGPTPNGRIHVVGHAGYKDICEEAMGIDWMNRDELSQAIPPTYTEYIGQRILDALRRLQLDEDERQQLRYDYNCDFVEAMT